MSFFLSGHLSGLSELRLDQRLLLLLAGEPSSFSLLCFRRAIFFLFFFCICGCLWTFFFVPCTSMLSSSFYRPYSVAVPQAQHSPAQSARTKVSTRPPECDNVSKLAELVRTSTFRRACMLHAEFSERTEKSKHARPTKLCNYSQH